MSEYQEYDQNINDMLDNFEKETKALDKKDAALKKKAIQRNQTYLKSIEQMIQSYKLDLQELDKNESSQYTESLKQINSRHMRLKNEFEFKKNEGTDREQLFQGRNASNQDDPANMTGEELMQKAKNIQEDGTEILSGLVMIIEQNNQLADQINSELDDQITKLDNIYKDVKDTQTELKRTQQYLRYFMRQIYTDKILMCLICLIFVAAVSLIILSSLGIKITPSSSSSSSSSSGSTNGGTPKTKRFLAFEIGTSLLGL